jgi:3-oxoacyl-[acyl-carrier protein] reductase
MTQLEGKVALVTGSGRGIGRSIALKLAAEGARVVVNDVDVETAEAVSAQIKKGGGEAVTCNGSVSAPDFAERFIKSAMETYKGLDIIVNNAGYTWDSVIQKMTDEQWYAMIDVHLTAPFRILRAAQPVIRTLRKAEEAQGREIFRKVVNISSIAGLGGNAGQANYATAKAGVIGLTKALSKEWGRLKVNVNCVAFGLIKTRLTEVPAGGGVTITVEGSEIKVGINPDLMAMLEQNIPLGRAGTPDEAAEAVYSLCAPQSNYISGQVVVCGGGISI